MIYFTNSCAAVRHLKHLNSTKSQSEKKCQYFCIIYVFKICNFFKGYNYRNKNISYYVPK